MNSMIDLNADLGEDESAEGIARDLAMMDIISSCNIACGGHAGSPENMKRMLMAAKAAGVAAGAHPSYPDRKNFGRISLNLSMPELRDTLEAQLKIIRTISSQAGVKLTHIKPHGALYNDAQDREDLTDLLIGLAASNDLPLVGMPETLLQEKATYSGVLFIAEAFIDRRYTDAARLVPRSENRAVIDDESERLLQGTALASGYPIVSNNGHSIDIKAQTLCLHSDSTDALETAQAMRTKLEDANIAIKAVTIA